MSRFQSAKYTAPPSALKGTLIALFIVLVPIVIPWAFKAAENPKIDVVLSQIERAG